MRNDSCPVCHTQLVTTHFSGPPETLRCSACGLLFLAEFPSAEERAARYQSEYYEAGTGARFCGPLEALVRWFRRRRAADISRRVAKAAVARPSGKPSAFLDVGCGRGLLLDAFRRAGWEAVGTQLSQTAAQAAQARSGARVLLGELPELALETGSFRAAALYHVLEHVDRPLEHLSELRRLLEDDGLLVVEVPDAGALGFRWLTARCFTVDSPNHLFFFTLDTLTALLKAARFEVEAVERFSLEYAPFTTLQNLLNLLGGEPNRLYRALQKNAGGRKLRRSPVTWLHAALGVLLAPVALAIAAASRWLPTGNTLRVYARAASTTDARATARAAQTAVLQA